MKAFVLFLLLAVPALTTAQTLEKARRLAADGNHREAADLLKPLATSAKTQPKVAAAALESLVQCLDKLDSNDELSQALELAVQSHPQSHLVLGVAGKAFSEIDHDGQMLRGEFMRDSDGESSAEARDRIRSLQLLLAAVRGSESALPQERAEVLWALYDALTVEGRMEVGDFTKHTDINTMPGYDADYDAYYGDGGPYPVDAAGHPFFFKLPVSWDAAKNDGERVRWILDQIGRLAPGNHVVTDAVWAQHLHTHLRSGPLDSKIEDIRSLADDEAWTLTAAGPKRFRLPADHAFIRLYRDFLLAPQDVGPRILPVGLNLDTLRIETEIDLRAELLDRHQRTAVVADLRALLAREENKEHREAIEYSIDQIAGAWGRFLGLPPQPTGKKATLQFRFRNATEVSFTARKVDVAAILTETEKRFSTYREYEVITSDSEPKDPLVEMHSIGSRLMLKGGEKFLSAPVAEWKMDLKPAARHEDTTTMVNTPLSEGGAYFIEATLAGGHKARCVLWLESIALVRTPVKEGMHYFLADAVTGAPVAGAELRLFGFKVEYEAKKHLVRKWTVQTATDGTAVVPGAKLDEYTWLLTAQLADGQETHFGFDNVNWSETDDQIESGRLYIITDRPVYRPGQKVSWHAWAKRVGYDPKFETNAFAHRDCRVIITSPRDDKLSEQKLTTDEYGALQGSITLADGAALGTYNIQIIFEDRRPLSQTQSFQVEEYKKPEFAVQVEAPALPVLLGSEIEFKIRADYYFGGAVKNGAVRYTITRTGHDESWHPPGAWDWLYRRQTPVVYDYHGSSSTQVVSQDAGRINEQGFLSVRVPTQRTDDDKDYRYELRAEVTDASRRVIAGNGSAMAVRQAFEAHVVLDRGWYAAGDSAMVTVDARSADGQVMKAKGSLVLFHGDKRVKNFPVELPAKSQFRLSLAQSGQYRLELTLQDENGHEAKTTRTVFAHGNDLETVPGNFTGLEIEVEKKEYQPGEEVRLLIHTSKPGSTVVLFLRAENEHAGKPMVLRLDQKTSSYSFPVSATDQPNLFWVAYTLHDARRHDAGGEIQLPPVQRVVKVELTTDATTYAPRGNCRARLVARDSAGKPIPGRVVLTAYDKSLKYISEGSKQDDIRAFFWGWKRYCRVHFQDTLRDLEQSVKRDKDEGMADLHDFVKEYQTWNHGLDFSCMSHPARAPIAPAPVSTGASEPETAVMIRSNFADSAVWRHGFATDADGTAEVEFPFPDNLTTWKLKAWVMGPKAEVGEAEVEVITRKDLLVRLQAPRFFVEKDEVVLSAIVHNDHDTAQNVETTLDLENGALQPVEPLSAIKSLIPAYGEKRLEWPVKAVLAGEAKIRVIARAKAGSDAMEMSFPVRVRGSERVESQSITLRSDDVSKSVSFNIPAARRAESAHYQLRYTPSLVPTILDALPPLIEYPHGCAEQTLNRFVPAVVAVDLLKRLKLKHPVYTEAKARSLAHAGLERLHDMRRDDGGWGWFPGAREPSAHMTALIVRGLQLARYAGQKDTDELIEEGAEWLQQHEANELERLALPKKDRRHKPAPDDTDALVHAALSTEKLADAKMRGLLYEHRAGLSRHMIAILGLICHQEKEMERRDMCLRNLQQHLQKDDATQTAWLKLPADGWWRWENDPIETQAAFLRLLLVTNPRHALAPPLVKHLVQNRRHTTHWNSTRDTAAVIQALTYYLQVSREATPDMDVEFVLDGKTHSRVHLDAKNLLTGDHRLRLDSTLLPTGKHTLEIRKTGTGSLYAAGALTLFSQEEQMPSSGLDIQTQRRFYRIEDKSRTEIASDTPLRSGDLIEVELTLESKNDTEYLLVEDFKPAGFEAVSVRSGWSREGLPCYQEFRDEKVCLYVEHLRQGRHTLRYHVRAETPGRFTALPTQVSAMYAPDLRANSSDWKARVSDLKPESPSPPRR